MYSPAIDETKDGSIPLSKIADLRRLVNDTACANPSLVPPPRARSRGSHAGLTSAPGMNAHDLAPPA